MILIHINKEDREPKVGEWTWDEANNYQGKFTELDTAWDGCKALSLSVILDAPYKPPYEPQKEAIEFLFNIQEYPILNSEEIFQWLSDNGKLGEEWVEFEGSWDQAVEGGEVDLFLPIAKFADLSCTMEESPLQQCLKLLRDLADLQNGPPLETYRKDWDHTMTEVYNFLEKHEKK